MQNLVFAQRRDVIAHADALIQLLQFGPAQYLIQLGLADQNDLEQLHGFGL